jgi:hypothetical protein
LNEELAKLRSRQEQIKIELIDLPKDAHAKIDELRNEYKKNDGTIKKKEKEKNTMQVCQIRFKENNPNYERPRDDSSAN